MINLEVCNTANIKEIKVKLEKLKVTLQGINYYKSYDIPKGVVMKFDNNCLSASFDMDLLKTKLQYQKRNSKFFTIIKDSIEYNKIKGNKLIWTSLMAESKDCDNPVELNMYEKNARYKSHTMYTTDFISIDNEYCLQNDEENITLSKKVDSEQYMKTNGGIIFDCDNNFIQRFNNSLENVKNAHLKNYLISDILPRQENELNFTFKHIKNIKQNLALEHTRLIIYYPTKEMLSQLNKLIKNKLERPRVVWLVFPSSSHDFLNFNEVLNILFWSKNFLKTFNPSIISLKCGENKTEPKKHNQIIVEKVKYKLNQKEINLLSDTSRENLSILDKLYFYNLGESLPKIIFECKECPICCMDLVENKDSIAYMPCGHMFCSQCVMETIKIKNCCPSCRKVTKFNGIIIPNLVSTKMRLLLEILKKVQDDCYTIIYTDTFTLSKKLMMYINELENSMGKDNICNIINQKSCTSHRDNERILICPVENDFLCQNIKNIKNVIVLTTTSDYALKSESLGYDYCHGNSDVKLWFLECVH